MTHRDAARALLADHAATIIERRHALMLIAGTQTQKAQDEIIIQQWQEQRRLAS